jgi:hypothetical protein
MVSTVTAIHRHGISRLERARHRVEARIYASAIGAAPAGKLEVLIALFTEKGFAARVIRKRLRLPVQLHIEDRRVLEQIVFPHYRSLGTVRRVLFVGCDWYTAHYERFYFAGVDYWTVEPDAAHARFGARQHVVAALEDLDHHFQEGFFDLIICNGVFGWGLDAPDQCDAAFSQCYRCLAAQGHMLLGWDDLPARSPVPLEQIPSLGRFRKYTFAPLKSWRYLTDTPYRHTYDFYQK